MTMFRLSGPDASVSLILRLIGDTLYTRLKVTHGGETNRSDGMRVELEERVRKGPGRGGGGGNLRPSARVFPRSHVSRSFVSRSRDEAFHSHLENCRAILPSLLPFLQFTLANLARSDPFFRFATQPEM